jgi:DNA-binding response OmpR family regulator/EAL domain-containing protein (putative c-di-GMP-specific phosphodiesterase class I)
MPYNKDSGTNGHGKKTVNHDLLLLHRNKNAREKIEKAIALREWRYRVLADLPELHDALAGDTKAVLIDASYLPDLQRYLSRMELGKRERPGLFFVSDRCDVETRLQAMRAGASQLFSEPFDLDALITALEEYISPKVRPPHKVLIVEDDVSQAKLVADLLRKGAFETCIVTEPLDIIDAIWRFQPDLIFMLDLGMHGVDSTVLTRVIRDRKESAAIPIIFLSGEDGAEKKMLALKAGADDFLTMPIQLQQLLTTVRSRIERAQVISVAGVTRGEVKENNLPARKALLERLKQTWLNPEAEGFCHGLIVLALGDPQVDLTDGDANRLIGMVVEWFAPLLQRNDYLARIGHCSLALLSGRPKQQDVERLADLTYEIINYKLAALSADGRRLGIGLVLLDGAIESAEALLQRGETAASSAYQRSLKGYLCHGWTPSISREYWVAEPAAHAERFPEALWNGSVSLLERRFVDRREGERATKVLELMPQSSDPNAPDNLYQLAAQHRVAAEFDRFVCDLAIHRLAEYTQLGESVRLILRQSVAVMEDKDYLEFIKVTLRKLQIVGTGLMLEFELPSLAIGLSRARLLFKELAALGFAISLSNFACSRSAYKAISYLKADAVRPRSSLLNSGEERIEQISRMIHALNIEIILPHMECHDPIAPLWFESTDYIQADFVG